MLQTIVRRYPADKRGPDITDEMLTTIDAQIERGRGEINENSTSRIIANGNCPASTYIEPGATLQITDIERGVYFAVCDSWALTIEVDDNNFTATTAISMERE